MAMFDVFKKKKPEQDAELPDIPPLPELPPLPGEGGAEIPSRLPQPPKKQAPWESGTYREGGTMLPPRTGAMRYPEPEMPEIPSYPKPGISRERGEPEMPREMEIPKPEPLQMPRPEPRPVEARRELPDVKGLPGPPPLPKRPEKTVSREPIEIPEITPPKRPEMGAIKPHLFVKIDKYREVVDSVDKLKSELTEIRKTIKDLEGLDSESTEKLQACETITNKIAELVTFFEQSFTAPEE